ncbi:MAG: transglutaminase-like domain-containing protein, partial [Sciscionella sp.]
MSRRAATAWGILAVWLVAVAWLIDRDYLHPHRTRSIEGALAVSPSAQYFRVEAGGRQVGFASTTIDTLPGDLRTPAEIQVSDVLVTEVPVLGKLQHIEVRGLARLSRLLQLISFSTRLHTPDGMVSIRGYVDADTMLFITVQHPEAAGQRTDTLRQLRLRLQRPLVLTSVMPLRLVFGRDLTPGARYDMQVFDPLRLELQDVALTVAAESTWIVVDSARHDSLANRWFPARTDTVRAWRINQRRDNSEGYLWLDETGQVVAGMQPGGFTVQREAFELAFENFQKRDTLAEMRLPNNIVAATMIESHGRPGGKAARAFTVLVRDTARAALALAGDGQFLRGDTVEVRRAPDSLLDGRYQMPAGGRFAGDLASTVLIQSSAGEVRAAAREATGGTTVPRLVAQRLTRWVFAHTTRAVVTDVPNATRTLRTSRGDCNELAVLYVAMARAAGLPARTAAGLVYAGDRFYFHAWAEVYLNGWVPVDPTLGQFPADAAHLRLSHGLA